MSIFNDKVLKSVAEAAAKVMQAEATKPMTDKEKSLAALGHPKDKITHKDVLIGRGVLKKEEVVDESRSIASKTYHRIVGTISPELKKRLAAADEKRRENARQLMQRPTKPTNEESQKEEIEQVDEAQETKAEFVARQKRLAAASAKTAQNPERQKRLMKIPGYSAAMDLAKKTTSDMKKEEVEQVEEGWDDMMKASKERQGPQPSGGAGIKKGTRYGGGRQKDEPESGEEEKKSGRRAYGARQNFKRSTRVNESFIDLLQKYNEEGLKAFVSLEEEPDNEQFTKELEDQKASMAGKKKQASVAAPSTQGVKSMPEEIEVFDADQINGTTVDTIEEREMTDAEMQKREKIVKSMKKGLTGFKQRYGERAKNVMYATATKQAMKD